MNLTELAKQIEQAQRTARIEKHRRPWWPSATSATLLGYRCERRIVYQRVHADLASPISEELASIFEEGKYHERQVRTELAALGFEMVEGEVLFRDERLDINGAIDGKLQCPDPEARHGQRRVPAEIKCLAGLYPKSQALWRGADGLMGRYYDQLQLYLYLTSEPDGIGFFKDKMTGLWHLCPVTLDPPADVLPDRIADRSECDGCPFRDTTCHPADAACDPVLLAGDAALAAQIAAREETKPTRDGWEALDESLKTRFKNTKGERFVCGDFLITKKPHGKGVRVDFKRLSADSGEST
jgi:hypothetical protein